MNLLFMGNKRRTTEATNANQTSSRSHAILQIVMNSTPRTKNTSIEATQGKLSLIDLAGSERGTVTENRGIRLREGAKINRSLLALANCINALGDKSKKGFFVPYRDSKLTRLLKDSLGGNCKTVMIAAISPASSQIEETINTLKYANRAKNIKTKAMSNKKMVSVHIAEYKNIINDLRQEIEELKHKIRDNKDVGGPYDIALVPSSIPNQINVSTNSQNLQQVNKLSSNPVKSKNLQDCPCFCGRAEDDAEMKKIQAGIFENFQERIQLRRALMEVEEQNALNVLEIRKKQAEIMVWKKDDDPTEEETSKEVKETTEENKKDVKRPLSAFPKDIKNKYKNIQTLRLSTDKNALKREVMNIQLAENISVAKRIRDSIPKRINHKDKKEYLEMVIKNHVLELQNIELEIHLQIQEKTINDLKNIIQSQKKLIQDHKLDDIKMPWEENNELLSERISQEDSQEIDIDDLVYDDEVNDDEAEIDDDDKLEELEYKEYIEKNKNLINNMDPNVQKPKLRKKKNTQSMVDLPNLEQKRHGNQGKNNSTPPEENKENKNILENNYVSDDKKVDKSRDVLTSVEINDAIEEGLNGDIGTPKGSLGQGKKILANPNGSKNEVNTSISKDSYGGLPKVNSN